MEKKHNLDFLIIIACLFVILTNNLIFIIISILYSTIKYIKEKQLKKYAMSILLIYITGILYFTIFSDFYHRSFIGLDWNINIFKRYISSCNFIPLKTIIFYINCFFTFSEQIETIDVFINLVGNFICLIPLAIFIPYFVKKKQTRLQFLIYIILISIGIEIIQLLTMTGSFDIDDIILNVSGSMLFYLYYFKEINLIKSNKKAIIEKSNIIKFVIKTIVMIFIITLIIVVFVVREIENKKYWNDYHFEKMTLLNYDNVCNEPIKNKIYEDELYNYYINCDNIEKIKIEINGNIFYLKEYLNGETMYPIIIHKLEDTGIEIIREAKNEKILICPEVDVAVNYRITNDEIADVVLAEFTEKNGKRCIVYYVVPKNIGSTNVTFEFDKKQEEYTIALSRDENKYKVLIDKKQ